MFSRPPPRNKHEYEYRLQRLHAYAPYRGLALVAVASAVPLGVVTWLLQEFAGQTTNLNISLVASFSIVANFAMGGAVWRKHKAMMEQSAELNRLRGRVEQLEQATLGGQVRKPSKRP